MFENLPSPTTVIASSSSWANAFVADWMVFVYIGVGVIAAFLFIRFLVGVFLHGMNSLTNWKRNTINENKEMVPGSFEASRAMFREHNRLK